MVGTTFYGDDNGTRILKSFTYVNTEHVLLLLLKRVDGVIKTEPCHLYLYLIEFSTKDPQVYQKTLFVKDLCL